MEKLESVERGKYEVFEAGVGVLQLFVLATMEMISVTIWGLV